MAPGLNLKGKCPNVNCKSNSDKVSWVHKGFGEFNMNTERVNNKCQSCNHKLPAKTIMTMGITKAEMKVKGIKYEDDEEVDFETELKETEGKFIYYTDFDEDVATWLVMNITIKPLK